MDSDLDSEELSRDKASVMLCQQHQGNLGHVARGAVIRHPPANFSWAYEFQIEGPDGEVVCFVGEPKSAPIGEFKP